MKQTIFVKFINLLLCLGFVIALWIPLSQMQFNFTPVGENTEKRELASFPAFNIRYPTEFILSFDKYFNDNFGYRQKLITMNNNIMVSVFNYSPATGVVLGQKGWLYFSPGLTDNFKRPPYTKADLELSSGKLKDEQEYFKKKGIYFIAIIPPDKHTVYPQFLPKTLNFNSRNPRRAQWYEYMHRHTDIALVDPLPALEIGAKKYPVYYKTDTHWNDYGSFIGYQEVMKNLKTKYPNLDPLTLDDFDVNEVNIHEPGDLSIILGIKDKFPDTDIDMKLKDSAKSKFTPEKKLKKIMVYHDSFFDPYYHWTPIQYLKYHFDVVVHLHGNLAFDNATIEKEMPDVIIYESAERYL